MAQEPVQAAVGGTWRREAREGWAPAAKPRMLPSAMKAEKKAFARRVRRAWRPEERQGEGGRGGG